MSLLGTGFVAARPNNQPTTTSESNLTFSIFTFMFPKDLLFRSFSLHKNTLEFDMFKNYLFLKNPQTTNQSNSSCIHM